MFGWLKAIVAPVFGIADKLVMDKDKYAELQFRRTELKHDKEMKLLEITTTPKVDALVKLLITFRDVVLPLLRPVGSAIMTGFVIYAEMNDITLSPAVEALMAAAFPGWMASRHKNKQSSKD